MITLGYILFFCVGLLFSFIGVGGSILTMPILVFIFSINPILATSHTFYVVGIIAIIGSIGYFKKKLIGKNDIIYFSLPSAFGVFVARYFILPFLPEYIFGIVPKNSFIIMLSAFLMILSAVSYLKKEREVEIKDAKINAKKSIITAFFVGSFVGILGAGGGFLMIPVLHKFLKLDIKRAVGASLAAISINSIIGIVVDQFNGVNINFEVLPFILLAALLGMLLGLMVEFKVTPRQVKTIFGFSTLLLGISLFVRVIFNGV